MRKVFVVLAALPLVALAILALCGARADVGVVTTGAGAHAMLGAAWVAAWLASVIGTPIALGAVVVASALGRPPRQPARSHETPEDCGVGKTLT